MMEIVKMSKKELSKGEVMSKIINKQYTQMEGARVLNLSVRQIKRLCKRFRNGGLANLAHSSRGKISSRKIEEATAQEVLELIKNNYSDFGPQLIKEQLEKRHNLKFSREWVRQLLIRSDLWQVKSRKLKPCYQRRKRRSREGELLQIDGSYEYWFEDRAPKCCLINMVDDATGKIMEMRFVEYECLKGYLEGMKRYIKTHGLPLSIYSDKHTIFKSPKSEESYNLSQFGRAMKELNIELIHANTPQAKGRVERSHGTLQDRLIKLMSLEGISSLEEGNRYLESFRKDYNSRFGRLAFSKSNAHRSVELSLDLDRVLCRKEKRKVSKNLLVQYKHTSYQLVPGAHISSLFGKSVFILELSDSIKIEYNGKDCEYKIFNDQPYESSVMSRKRLDAFLDKKKPMSAIERHRKGIRTL